MNIAVSMEQVALLELLETMLANSPSGFCILDENLRYVCVNEAFSRMNGYAPSQLLGGAIREETPEFALMAEAAIRRVSQTNKAVLDVELKFVPSANRSEIQYASAGFYPLARTASNVMTIAVMVNDITARKISEQLVRESEERYRLLFDHSPYPIFVIRPDTGRFLAVNAAAIRNYGYSREEFLSMNVEMLRPEGTVPAFLVDYSQVMKRSAAISSAQEGELRHRRKDNTLIDVEISSGPVVFRGVEAHLVLAHDITDRKRGERKFRGLLESAPDAMVITNNEAKIVLLNAQAETLFGYHRDELLGQKIEMLIPESYRNQHESHTNEYFNRPEAMTMGRGLELSGLRKDGVKFPIEVSLSPLETSEGVLISSAIRDTTEKKKAEEKLKILSTELARSNTALEQFASIASHDLREPMRMIVSFVTLLRQKNIDRLDSDSLEYMSLITDGSKRMMALIEDLFHYSEVGGEKHEKEKIDLNAATQKALANLKIATQESQAKITHDLLPTVLGDGIQLVQLFQNLIANSIKYRRLDVLPEIHVSAKNNENDWLIEVKDNGIGFEMDHAKEIFNHFYRLHGRSEYSGSGLGLATCKRIVEQHGGRIWAESELGKGTSFFFTVPHHPKITLEIHESKK